MERNSEGRPTAQSLVSSVPVILLPAMVQLGVAEVCKDMTLLGKLFVSSMMSISPV